MKTKMSAEKHFKYFCIHDNKFCLKMIGWILSSPVESAKMKTVKRLLRHKVLLTNLVTGFPTYLAAQTKAC